MLVHRVFPREPAARPHQSGHRSYIHRPQGRGHIDSPPIYDLWYFALSPEAAVGEVFGGLPVWSGDMFIMPPGLRRAFGVYEVSDDLPLLDLDDARRRPDRGLRPTQVITRNRPATQIWALTSLPSGTTTALGNGPGSSGGPSSAARSLGKAFR